MCISPRIDKNHKPAEKIAVSAKLLVLVYSICQFVNHVVLPLSRPGYHSLYIQLDRACMAGHAQAAFNYLNTLKPIKNIRSIDKIF
jgi:hypothetical protein